MNATVPSLAGRARRLIGAAVLAIPLSLAALLAAQDASSPLGRPDSASIARLRGFRWRSIGPAGQGGRIADLAVDEARPSTYYVGFAVSGVWKTVNNGTTFSPIFDTYGVSSVGAVALSPSDPDVLYVGTGEANNRQTSSAGNGVWKSLDGGAHFRNIGLRNSQSIARIVVHPKNPDVVWVAVAGHLFGPDAERGIFQTTDGGKTWLKSLYVNEDTGATDLAVDPANPANVWAAMYEHRRTAWGYVGGGPGSGLFHSTNGGRTWTKITGRGLPRGTMGRIGLAISRSRPNVLYAQIEVAPDHEPRPAAGLEAASPAAVPRPTAAQTGRIAGRGAPGPPPPDPQSSGIWRSDDRGKRWQFMSNEDQRPMYFSQIRVDPKDPNVVYVGGVSAGRSIDGGRTFTNIEGHKGHVDNHAIWIDPGDSRHVMYGSDGGLDVSWDAGSSWEAVRLWAVGLAYHVSADFRHPYRVCTGLQDNGSWCGPSRVRSGAIRSWSWFNLAAGDGFQNQIDPEDPTVVYTESQNLGLQRHDLSAGAVTNIRPNPLGRGRGAAANVVNLPSPPPPDFVSQFNWNSPIRLSSHDASTLYAGGRQLFISRDRGQTWTVTASLGKDIDISRRQILGQSYALPACGRGRTRGVPCLLSKHDGYLQHEFGTLTEIAESPVLQGVLWAGTDDGNVQVSRDDGESFTEVGANIPAVNHEYYVSGLEASWFDAGTAYVALDGHRNDDWRPFVFKTTDYGATWQPVSGNLPAFGQVNSIRQDPVNAKLLYAATETGFYVSLDDGERWTPFMPGLPHGRVDEVLVHPREHDLILATHSRSVWIMDDISPLEQMSPLDEDAPKLFKPRDAVLWKADRRTLANAPGDKHWQGDPAPRGTAITWLLTQPATDVRIALIDTASGRRIFSCAGDDRVGLQLGVNRFQWSFTVTQPSPGNRGADGGAGPRPANRPSCGAVDAGQGSGPEPVIHSGVYRVTLTVDGKDLGSQTFSVLDDVWLSER